MKRVRPGSRADRGVTMIELVVVAVIIGILATIATNVFIGEAAKAKVAATRTTIRELAVAVVRHEIDTGEMPLSGSGEISTDFSTNPPTVTITSRNAPPLNALTTTNRDGCGFLYLALAHSMSGDASNPYPITWIGPYIEFNADIIQISEAGLGGNLAPGQIQILDAFGFPIEFVMAREYDPANPYNTTSYLGGIDLSAQTFADQGTQQYGPGQRPGSADTRIPDNNPFHLTEVYYNRSTFQLYSVGANGTTYDGNGATPPADDPGEIFAGTENGDISNFGY